MAITVKLNSNETTEQELIATQRRLDSILASLATKIGMQNADKREAVIIKPPKVLSFSDIDNLFEGDKYAAKLVGQLPGLCTRKNPIYTIKDIGSVTVGKNGSGDAIAGMQQLINKAMPYFNKAMSMARKYGGSVIILGCNDGATNLESPLDTKKLKDIEWLNVQSGGIGGQVSVYSYQDEPTLRDYGEPLLYQFSNGYGTRIHKSRLLAFKGIDVGVQRSRERYGGFGMSVLVRAYADLRDYNLGKDSIAVAIQDFNRMLIKMAGLSNLLSQNRRKEVEQRLQVMNYISSVLNVWLLDTTDGHEIVSRNFTGVADMMKILKEDLGANTEIPHTSFFNQSPSGITSGESETKELNQTILKYQKEVLKEPLERLVKLYHFCKNGVTGGIEPCVWEIDFPVIYEENAKEKQELANLQAQERAVYKEIGAITSDEIRKALALNLGLEGTIDLNLSQSNQTGSVE